MIVRELCVSDSDAIHSWKGIKSIIFTHMIHQYDFWLHTCHGIIWYSVTCASHPVLSESPSTISLKSIVSLLTCLVLHRLCSWCMWLTWLLDDVDHTRWMWCASRMCVCYWTIDTRQSEFKTQLWLTSCTCWIQVGWGVSIIIRTWMMIIAGIHRSCSEKIRKETHCKPWIW